MTYFKILAIAFIFLVTTIPIHSQVVDKKSITLDGANKVIAASIAEAKRLGSPGVLMDLTQLDLR